MNENHITMNGNDVIMNENQALALTCYTHNGPDYLPPAGANTHTTHAEMLTQQMDDMTPIEKQWHFDNKNNS